MRQLNLTFTFFFLALGLLVAQTEEKPKEQMQMYSETGERKDFQAKGVEMQKGMQVVINEGMQLMSAGSNNALTMAIPGADKKKVEHVWKEFSKDFKARTKRDRKSGMYFSDDAKLRSLSGNDIDVYARFDEGGSGTVATVWFDLGGAYLASETHESSYEEAEELMTRFANAVGKSMAEDNVHDQEKILKGMNKELDKLEKDQDTYHKKIEEAKALIAEMEGNIKQNEKDQENKKVEIQKQEDVIVKAKDKVKEFIY
ncbi:MAG: hypothetical protein AAGG68_18945 [Bacteroidota bacterium]